MAERIVRLVPSVEKVRMCNSGTEATMSAVRLARGYTGRSKIIKFSGCYHGHVDSLLVKAGSGALTFGNPDSAGIPDSFARETGVLGDLCRAATPRDPAKPVRVPGDRAAALFAEQSEKGVALHPEIMGLVAPCLEKYQIPVPKPLG